MLTGMHPQIMADGNSGEDNSRVRIRSFFSRAYRTFIEYYGEPVKIGEMPDHPCSGLGGFSVDAQAWFIYTALRDRGFVS